VLGKRLVEKPSGYWLDVRPVSNDTIVLLKASGGERVGPEKWQVRVLFGTVRQGKDVFVDGD
jgi:hypothetical protein